MSITFPISPDYLSHWTITHALRELVANAVDGEARHAGSGRGQMSLEWKRANEGTLVITNDGIELPERALVLGESESRGRADCIGTFGEGLTMALLVLARERVNVKVFNNSWNWTPSIVFDEALGRVLTVKTHAVQPTGNFKVEVRGISKESWETIQGWFLRTHPTFNALLTVRPSPHYPDRILLQPEFAGRLYVKGVFVRKYENLTYGYDVDMPLNRDRSLVDEWDLKLRLSRLLTQGMETAPDRFAPMVLDLLERGDSLEVDQSYYLERCEPLVQAAVTRFHEKYGEGAVPVESMTQSRELEFFGKNGIPVSKSLKSILEKQLGTFEEVKKGAAESATSRFAWSDLTEAERSNLECATMLLTGAGLKEPTVNIVSFADRALLGRVNGLGEIELSRGILTSVQSTFKILVHEIAHGNGGDGERSHGDKQVDLVCQVLFSLL